MSNDLGFLPGSVIGSVNGSSVVVRRIDTTTRDILVAHEKLTRRFKMNLIDGIWQVRAGGQANAVLIDQRSTDLAWGVSSYRVLSVAGGEAPTSNFSKSEKTGGAVAAELVVGGFGSHKLTKVDGANILGPRNLVKIQDAISGKDIVSVDGAVISGLLQVENGAVDGVAFDDASQQVQISLVKVSVSGFLVEVTVPGDLPVNPVFYVYRRRDILTPLSRSGTVLTAVIVGMMKELIDGE